LTFAVAIATPLAAAAGEKIYRLAELEPSAASLQYTHEVTLPELAKLGFSQGRNLVLDARVGDASAMPDLAACRTGVWRIPATTLDCVWSGSSGWAWQSGSGFGLVPLRLIFGKPTLSYRVLRAKIRFMFHAIVTRLHSPRTLSSPRSRNWRKPRTDLTIPNTGSGVCFR